MESLIAKSNPRVYRHEQTLVVNAEPVQTLVKAFSDAIIEPTVFRRAWGRCSGRFGPAQTVVGLVRLVAEMISGPYDLVFMAVALHSEKSTRRSIRHHWHPSSAKLLEHSHRLTAIPFSGGYMFSLELLHVSPTLIVRLLVLLLQLLSFFIIF